MNVESDTSTSAVQLSMAEISIRGISSSQEIERSVGTPMNSGEIPSELGNLPNLNHLWLDNNQLIGEIPPGICKVRYLYISNNQLCPPYPSCISQDDIDSQDTSNCP